MFSGGDSSGEFNNLRLAASSGSGGGITDWATLAQQWIAMRDSKATPSAARHISMPDAPPPPNISGNYQAGARTSGTKQASSMTATATSKKSTFEEQGEADMDMDDDEDHHDRRQDTPPPPAPSMHIGGNTKAQHNIMQPQWFVQHGQTQPTLAGIEMVGNNRQQWNAWPPAAGISLPSPAVITPVLHTQSHPQHGLNANSTSHIPSLMKISVSNPNAMKTITHESNADGTNASPTATMDAAKRKILPAWIREGLEKMEREKLKQMERQQQQPSSELNLEDDVNQHHTVKNKNAKTLESDSSGNDDDDDNDNSATNLNIDGERIVSATRLQLRSNANNDKIIEHTDVADHDATDIEATEPIVGKSYEENLADLMIIVRRTLTELLLEVTNDEIYNVAHETINLRKSKASSAQVIRKSALSSITGKLGLAAYDDSSSDAENSDSDNEKSSDNSEDSEDEIRASIRLKRRTFAKVSEEIEERIAASAMREEQKLKYYTQIEHETSKKQTQQQPSNDKKRESQDRAHHSSSSHHTRHESSTLSTVGGKGYERDFGETTESKLQHSNGKRQKERSTRKERTTRFSDNKDSRSASIATAASYISQMQTVAGNSANTSSATASLFQMATGGGATEPSNAHTVPTATYSGGSASASINKTLLNAAEAALEKVIKSSKSSSSSSAAKQHRDRDKRRRRHGGSRRHSSDDSSSDNDDDDDDESETSASSSSRNSKHSRTSSSKHKRSDRSDSRSQYRKHSTTSSRRRSKHSRRNDRSPNDYDSSRHSRHSSKRSRSRSRSSYSSSSRRRRH